MASAAATLFLLLLTAFLSSVSAQCGGTYDSPGGTILGRVTSKSGVPRTCVWTINPGGATKKVHIIFTSLDLSYSYYNYEYGYTMSGKEEVKLYNSTAGVNTLQGSYDGPPLPEVQSFTVSSNTSVRVEYTVNHRGVSTSGFRLIFFTDIPRWTRIASKEAIKECLHGGLVTGADCLCSPGFGGSSCETACGPDKFGNECQETCGGGSGGCRSLIFCFGVPSNETFAKVFYDGVSTCLCATGFEGPNCDEVCRPGRYGANCTQHCGFCNGHCDPFTGDCYEDCIPGFRPPLCQKAWTHLIDGLRVTPGTTSLTGSLVVAPNNTAGEGAVTFFQVQYRPPHQAAWTTGAFGALCDAGGRAAKPCVTTFKVDGLRPDTDHQVRALLLSDDMQSYEHVPHIVVRTLGQRLVADLMLSNVTSRSMQVSWQSPSPHGFFSVMYECVSLLACPGVSCEHADGLLLANGTTALLQGLVPFAVYRVTVSADDETDAATATTLMAVPDASVSGLRASHVTNVSAVVRWQEALACGAVNGPVSGYRWELHNGTVLRSGLTNNKVLVLRDLAVLSTYELRVNIVNAVGENERQWTSVSFKTLHTLPDAPRDLVVYRWNEGTLWLRWRQPGRPGGEVRYYVVERVGGDGRREVVSPTRCVAWPDQFCHAVHGLQADRDYTLSVRAVNEFGDEPGQQAVVEAATTTSAGVPGQPRNLRMKEQRQRSVVLEWQLPDMINSDLTHFEVIVKPKKNSKIRLRTMDQPVSEEKLWYDFEIPDLVPDTLYSVVVRCGWNGESASLDLSTMPEEVSQ